MFSVFRTSIVSILLCLNAQAVVTLSQVSGLWTAINGNYDYLADQQTGQGSDDIVGVSGTPGFYTAFDNNGTSGDLTDGYLAFRARMNKQESGGKTSFAGYLWVGVDGDTNGSIDAYIRFTGGSSGSVSIHDPGANSNVSPNTSSIVASPTTTYSLSTYSNFENYRAVTTADTASVNIGAPGDTNTDWYVSFQLPFLGLVQFLQGKGISINENTGLRYILATSTNPNSLNQDLGGVPKTYDGNLTWQQLGGMSGTISATGQVIPEPCASMLGMMGVLLWLVRRRR